MAQEKRTLNEVQFRVRLPKDEYEKVVATAERLGMTVGAFVQMATRAALFTLSPYTLEKALVSGLTPPDEFAKIPKIAEGSATAGDDQGWTKQEPTKPLQQEKVAAAYERAVEASDHDWSEAETWVETEPWDPEAKADGVEQPDVEKEKRHLHKYTKKTGDAPSDKGQRYGVFMCECGETTTKPIRS